MRQALGDVAVYPKIVKAVVHHGILDSVSLPHQRVEKKFRVQGYHVIAGVGEAGKGSWAGPIVAGAVILPVDFDPQFVNDSKILTVRRREQMFVHIARHAVAWAVGVVPSDYIDEHGIQPANVRALELALSRLHVQPEVALIDAVKLNLEIPSQSIIDGDAKVLSIAAASIVAKVVRDALMTDAHRLYPNYGFHQHKGYGTAIHRTRLKRHGVSPIHRQSFRPMKDLKVRTNN